MQNPIDLQWAKQVRAMSQVERLSCAETAKLVRKALKLMYPGVKFRVTSKTYSGGASIDVSWMDGPTFSDVRRITCLYEGATFDGMIDLKEYKAPVTINGKRVRFGADFVNPARRYSVSLMARAADKVTREYGWPMPEIRVCGAGQPYESAYPHFEAPEPRAGGDWGEWASTLINRAANEMEGEY